MDAYYVQCRLSEWVERVVTDENILWTIPIAKKGNTYGMSVNLRWLSNHLKISLNLTYQNSKLVNPVNDALEKLGIILPGRPAAQCDIRRKILHWYNNLSLEQKKELPISGNRLMRWGALGKIVSHGDLARGYQLVGETLDFIHSDLMKCGVLNPHYLTVAERKIKRNEKASANAAKKQPEFSWERLKSLPLLEISDFIETEENQLKTQFKQLFAYRSGESGKKSTVSNYKNGYSHLEKYLDMQASLGEHIKQELHPYILEMFKSEYLTPLVNGKEMSPSNATTILSSIKQALITAKDIKGLNFPFFYDVEGYRNVRVTNAKTPYSISERSSITNAIQSAIDRVEKLQLLYTRTEFGAFPQFSDGDIFLRQARWHFENTMNCEVVGYTDINPERPEVEFFLHFIGTHSQRCGLHETYEKLGVLSRIDVDAVIPYCLRLAQITGLNAESLLNIDIDDLVEDHPLSGRPCLTYWKERSTGGKEYHLDLFKADLGWLTRSQSDDVREVFRAVIKLTEKIRSSVSDEFKNKLFIYRSTGPKTFEKVVPLSSCSQQGISAALKKFVEIYGLKDDLGGPLYMNLSRFRSSFVSELIDRGVSLREIQHILGHKNIQTTIQYLDQNDLNQIARKKIEAVLVELHQKASHDGSNPKPKASYRNHEGIIFSTPLSGCKNIFYPPGFVKNLSSYVPGTPCRQYNKCLSCDNVLLSVTHLPELFAMRRDYLKLSERSRIMDTPYGSVVLENIGLLNNILDSQTSEFSAAELALAEEKSLYIQTSILVDGVSL